MTAFAIARDPVWRLPLLVIGATASRSKATFGEDAVELQFGLANVTIPYGAIRDVTERDWSWWLGVGLRIASDKTLGLIGSTRGVVQIAVKPGTVKGLLFLREPNNVAVSLEDPVGFIEAVQQRVPATYREGHDAARAHG